MYTTLQRIINEKITSGYSIIDDVITVTDPAAAKQSVKLIKKMLLDISQDMYHGLEHGTPLEMGPTTNETHLMMAVVYNVLQHELEELYESQAASNRAWIKAIQDVMIAGE